ncbi:acyltransferase [Bradyrhizobium sp. CB1015]|uniref:acyltransferase family protein n=1 Tax=Bradyrhizobium sp. CB1015 TaxID=2976822 RepID=UPI0021AA2219|nr:acyltransferase [Bradyrhizobium sp. CB1015]UWU91324.1 acyltransferase [Bradyrhizobium sp. CB1015]
MEHNASARINPYVHGARGLFCLMVFVYHVVHSGLPTFDLFAKGLLGEALQTGKFGVEFFFGISGIVILPSLYRASSVMTFILDRYARILPVLWATVIAIAIFGWLSGKGPGLLLVGANLLAPPPFIDIIQINPAAWSLGYEFLFYGVCAIVFLISGVSRPLALALAVSSLILLVYYPRALLMIGGVLIAEKYLSSTLLQSLAKYPAIFFVLFLTVWRGLELASATDYVGFVTPAYLSFHDWISAFPVVVLGGVFGTIFLLGLSRGNGLFGRMLRWQVMQWLGTISFSFYLWPPIVMAGVKLIMYRTGVVDALGSGSQLFFLLVSLPPSLIVATISHRFLEVKVTGQIRKRLDRTSQAKPAVRPISQALDGTEGGSLIGEQSNVLDCSTSHRPKTIAS